MWERNNRNMIEKQAIKRIVKRRFLENRMRNAVLILSIVLVTTLMTVMFGSGLSIFSNLELANLRIRGTTANLLLPHLQEGELESLAALPEIEQPGWQHYVAAVMPGEGPSSNYSIAMTAYSETEWEKHILPTLSDVKGTYPVQENEVMLSEWMLERLGIDVPEIGMEIPIAFVTLKGQKEECSFVLSGYFMDYICYSPQHKPASANTIAANLYYSQQGSTQRAMGNVVVSETFAQKYGILEGLYGTALINSQLDASQALDLVTEATGNKDVIVMGLSKSLAQSLTIAMVPMLSVLLIMIAGYLLVYNVVYISVLQEMHLYGQLKTLGATCRQLRQIVKRQTHLVALLGIPVGLLLGTVLAEIAVPTLLASLTKNNGFGTAFDTDIVISPLIYLFAALFAYLTVMLSNRKPARMAAQVSPVEAMKYVEQPDRKKARRGSKGGKLYRMAWRNVFRSRKKAVVTFASLFFGFLIFLVVGSCTYGADYEVKYYHEQPDSFTLTNLTFQTPGGTKDLLNENIIEEIGRWDSVEEMDFDYVQSTRIVSPDTFLEPYVERQASYMELTPQQVREAFSGRCVGLSLEKLGEFSYNSTLEEAEIQRHLKEGTGVFLGDLAKADYRELSGKTITLTDSLDGEISYTILGIAVSGGGGYRTYWSYYGNVLDNAVPLYTTEAGVGRLGSKTVVQTLRFQTDGSRDQEIQDRLEKLFAHTAAVQIRSQMDTKAGAEEIMDLIRLIGNLFAVFLILMGLINFVNVIFTNIYTRRKELATLESIGMTQGQIKVVLVLESFCYSAVTILLLSTLGVGISYYAAQLCKEAFLYFLKFGIPILNLGIVFIIMLVISGMVPVLIYRNIVKESVVERLRKGQD